MFNELSNQCVHQELGLVLIAYLKFRILLFVCNRGDNIQYHGGLQTRKLGLAPILVLFEVQIGIGEPTHDQK